jgi:hypothetical protein
MFNFNEKNHFGSCLCCSFDALILPRSDFDFVGSVFFARVNSEHRPDFVFLFSVSLVVLLPARE